MYHRSNVKRVDEGSRCFDVVDTDGEMAHIAAMSYDLTHPFRNLARYNQRMNQEMFDVLYTLTDRARKRDAGSWFRSIDGVLNHLIVTDINWLRRYRALSPESPVLNDPALDPPNLSWEYPLHEDFEDLWKTRAIVDQLIVDWFGEFPGDRYGESLEYTDSVGQLRPAMAGEAFEFLFIHQTHHRGQISQILDRIGLPHSFADNSDYLE